MITCLDTGRTFGEIVNAEATIRYGHNTGVCPAAPASSGSRRSRFATSATYARAASRPDRCRDFSRTSNESQVGQLIDRVARRPSSIYIEG